MESLWPSLPGDDNLNDVLYSTGKDAMEHVRWAWPAPVEEWMGGSATNAHERREFNECQLGRSDGRPVGRWDGGTGDNAREWVEERQWALKNLDAATVQFGNIVVATKEDGTFVFTKRNARTFTSVGKKDFVSASLYCYVAFLMWLKSDGFRDQGSPEDAAGFSGW